MNRLLNNQTSNLMKRYTENGPSFPYTLNPDEIPTAKVVDITPESGSEVHVEYACPRPCWEEHLRTWRKERHKGNKTAPEPMPFNHCLFENPAHYGCIAYGDDSETSKKAAWESHVRGLLCGGGWLRDTKPNIAERIIEATVRAYMKGENLGAAPFVACVATWL